MLLLLAAGCPSDAPAGTDAEGGDATGSTDTAPTDGGDGWVTGPATTGGGSADNGATGRDPTGDSAADSGPDTADTGPTTAGTDDGYGTGGSLDEVEAACEADCDAQFATECPPAWGNVLTCKLGCAQATVQLDGFCYTEYADYVECRADGGYVCVNGYPTPEATCAGQQGAYVECTSNLGCKRHCKDAIEADCETASFDGCVTACIAEEDELPGYCAIYLDSLHLCRSQNGQVCDEMQNPDAANCIYSIENLADCIYDETDDVCAGYCSMFDNMGCGSGCAASCADALAHPSCGYQFVDLVDCQTLHGDFACSDGALIGVDSCDYENMQYQNCLAG